MNNTLRQAVIGFIISALVDLTAWFRASKESPDFLPFDWALALKRWILGALVGGGFNVE